MTEYDRTPIEVADMRNGDLILGGNWDIEEAEAFVGIHPLNLARLFTVKDQDNNIPSLWVAHGDWHKLTPKPNPALCKNCGEEIVPGRWDEWFHVETRSSTCRPHQATPATESETA